MKVKILIYGSGVEGDVTLFEIEATKEQAKFLDYVSEEAAQAAESSWQPTMRVEVLK